MMMTMMRTRKFVRCRNTAWIQGRPTAFKYA